MTNKKPNARHNARSAAVQALYQWHFNHTIAEDLVAQFIQQNTEAAFDQKYFKQLVIGIIAQQENLDLLIKPQLDRSLASLNPIELVILRLGTYELVHCLAVPYKVVINEALDLTKAFGAEAGHKYVNAVLDKLAPTLRADELKK